MNPAHLFLGTRTDNNEDRKTKGRGLKMNAEKVMLARQLRVDGMKPIDIAAKLGVSHSQIVKILSGQAWKEVPGVTVHRKMNGRARLNEDDVRQVFQLRAEGMTQQQIAERIGISQPQVSNILRGEAWKEVDV